MGALQIKPRALAAGLASFLPGVRALTNRASGGTGSTRYCYSVWLRHLVRAHAAGLPTDPRCVAELGPGDSLGIVLAALLSGADRCMALDVKAHADAATNLRVFEELVALFLSRTPIPEDAEFPAVQPKLADYRFPAHLLTADRLAVALDDARLDHIRAAILGQSSPIGLADMAPWNDPSVIQAGSVDFLLSQAVLEHVDDLDRTYAAMRAWMKPGAFMSHSIDFSSHNLTRSWNGHWTLGDGAWRLVRGPRLYLINREPLSSHVDYLKRHGFDLVTVEGHPAERGASFRPAKRFRRMSEQDASTRSVFVQATAR